MILTDTHREIAQCMAWELESTRLKVGLAPCQRGRRHNRIRVVEETNPAWYQKLCREYPCDRTRPRQRTKPDTAIKRRHTIRALHELASGQAQTVYAQRLMPHVAKELERYEREITRHHSQPHPWRDSVTAPAPGWADPLVQSRHAQSPHQPAALLPEWAEALCD